MGVTLSLVKFIRLNIYSLLSKVFGFKSVLFSRTQSKKWEGGGETGYSNTDWDAYMQGRPRYPRSLIDLIYSYRKRQGGAQWNRIVDIGSGIGVALTHFAHDFKILHLSDPSTTNIESGRKFLTSWISHHGIETKLETSQAKGEEAYQAIGENVADLVICATAAHFMDPDGLSQSAAKLLRPGGTLAIFSYWAPLFPDTPKELHHAFLDAAGGVIKKARGKQDEGLDKTIGKVFRNTSAGGGGLDFMPMPDEYFKDKERISLNSLHAEDVYKKRNIDNIRRPGEVEGQSRTLPNENCLSFQEGTDREADGWSFNADRQFLINFISSLRAGGDQIADVDFEKSIAAFDTIYKQHCSGDKIRLLWPCKLILATRK